jgi:hypothetical protein
MEAREAMKKDQLPNLSRREEMIPGEFLSRMMMRDGLPRGVTLVKCARRQQVFANHV